MSSPRSAVPPSRRPPSPRPASPPRCVAGHDVNERIGAEPARDEILFLLHDGLSVPEIAAQLYVSLSTAKTYVARLYDKLDARNRAQALMTAVRLGMLRTRAPPAGPPAQRRLSGAAQRTEVCGMSALSGITPSRPAW